MKKLKAIEKAQSNSKEWANQHGGLWPKAKIFNYMIEETGEYSEELLTGDKNAQIDELGDMSYAYSLLTADLSINSFGELREIAKFVLEKIEKLGLNENKDLILGISAGLSKENKMIRKLEKMKANNNISELDLKKSQCLNWFLLSSLAESYNLRIDELVANTLSKFSQRDF